MRQRIARQVILLTMKMSISLPIHTTLYLFQFSRNVDKTAWAPDFGCFQSVDAFQSINVHQTLAILSQIFISKNFVLVDRHTDRWKCFLFSASMSIVYRNTAPVPTSHSACYMIEGKVYKLYSVDLAALPIVL